MMREKAVLLWMTIALCGFFPGVLFASSDIVFLGVLGDDSPTMEKGFDKRLREVLSVSPEYRVTDYLESMEFKNRINFNDYPTVSRRLVESLRLYSNDSTIFIWASVKHLTLKPVRTWLVRARIDADIALTLTVYSLRFKEFSFIGDVHGSASKSKVFIFFYPLERGVHISALDRSEIVETLIDQAALQSATMITAVVRSEKAKVARGPDTLEMKKTKEPTISDMFNVPYAEPKSLEKKTAKPSPSHEAEKTKVKDTAAVSPPPKTQPAPSAQPAKKPDPASGKSSPKK
jgi:hypothetical protein